MVTVVIKDRGTVTWKGPDDVTVVASATGHHPDESTIGTAIALGEDVTRALSAPRCGPRGRPLRPGSAEHAIAALTALPGVTWLAVSADVYHAS